MESEPILSAEQVEVLAARDCDNYADQNALTDLAVSHEALRAERDDAQSWDGVMAFIDEHYPPDVFDGSSGEEGPRIVALLRQVRVLTEALAKIAEVNGREGRYARSVLASVPSEETTRHVTGNDYNAFWPPSELGAGGDD